MLNFVKIVALWRASNVELRRGKGICFYGHVAKAVVIYAKVEQTSFLAHKEEISSYRQERWMDDTSGQRLID